MIIIAEIGINHNGDLEIAKQLIKMAKECGADAVKFQKRQIGTVYAKEFLDSPRESPWGNTQGAQKLHLEFGLDEYAGIDDYCRELGIDWFASAWDKSSQMFLRQFKLKYNKIASPMITDLNHLRYVAEEKKHTFISTGTAIKTNIDNAVSIFKGEDCPFTLMHCVNKYPCPDEDCELLRIKWLKETYDCPVGYSNHNPGILTPALAVLLGAEAIEVHITLDRTMYGSDQASSFEADGFRRICRDCRNVEKML